ncbi:MAG: undecaprenyl/decaprenyl-phosphate alpha-N-acetylglucosaminyl 1-phosphate transferase [Flavipsychrobacter sp.]|nr:undecaprenyl/decaprenyl-phosphate alpha-N-acetylglucosaminyl 1-phosphate transferase [Flavipsychrobacter sp.]
MTFDLTTIPHYILYLVALVASAAISMYAVRKVMFIMKRRGIFDTPDNTRKIHGEEIPTLGGIGIFIGYMVVTTFFMYFGVGAWHYVVASSILLFFTGIYDDLANMRPSKKLLVQLLAAAITIYFADIRITSLYGMFGINDLPYWVSIAISVIACTLFINAFNFIDGIDGLACGLTILYISMLGGLFASMSAVGMSGIAFGLIGAAIGLLYYNVAPAKIYMGDTGSMFLGFTIFVLCISFINTYGHDGSTIVSVVHSAQGAATIVLSVLFLPVYDALRVFLLRASKGTSPLHADRLHLHYYLLDAGFSHSRSVMIIMLTNVAIIALAWLMQEVNLLITLLAMTFIASLVLFAIYRSRRKKLGAV